MIMNSIFYQKKIEQALEYAEYNIGSDLSLQTISKIAGFSPYHFHRIFHSVTGKSLHQYILERRLNNCASKLLYEDCDITRIALDFGFSSSSSFARSFKKHFGCTPTQYKKTKDRKYPVPFSEIVLQQISFDPELEKHFNEIVLADLRTICIGVTGLSEVWENPEINRAYEQIFTWLKENKKFTSDTKICGITMDTPEVQNLSSCRYYACATAESYIHDEHLAYRVFQTSGNYICCKINRCIKDFAACFFKHMDYLYGFYMVSHKFSPDNRPFVEFYERMPDGDIYIHFCVPVKNSKK
ncbi:transcriptional regulator, AraC family [Ruminiclostridium cellulolyticum H10]|uniref:Transcriptional regulator, AraC family n=2 Tax=Ruminiclostridium cellulolyticum TaxID=1521 RepID=B8I6Y6_RUMCH|nr:transcriptional regulator, AraC family [Ruminiclostridium cellulolyticum H10]